MKFTPLIILALGIGCFSSYSAAQNDEATIEAALSELRAGRPANADRMFTQIINDKTSTSADLPYHAAQAAYNAGYYRRAKSLVTMYLSRTDTPLLYDREANALNTSLDKAIAQSFTSDASAFEYAQKKNTIFSYATYRRLYPEGSNLDAADFLSFRRAKEINVEIAYLRYQEYWPDGQFVEQAKRNADVTAFKEARHLNTLESYRNYLTNYPTGVFEPQATQREEAMAYTKASKDGSVIAIKDFISRHPKAYNRAEAEKLLATAIANAPLRNLSGPTVVIPAGNYLHRTLRRPGTNTIQKSRIIEIPIAFTAMAQEIIFDQWDQCVAEGGCLSYSPDDMGWGRGQRPVINVNRNDLDQFIDWFNQKWQSLNGQGEWRLPSEMEWAYMARGTNTNITIQRIEPEQSRKSCEQCETLPEPDATFPVRSFKANNFGLYDMLGNAQEWVLDCWHPNLNANAQNGSPWLEDQKCTEGVVRGPSDYSSAVFIAQQARREVSVNERHNNIGFRLIRGIR